jgi:hypothetical protein
MNLRRLHNRSDRGKRDCSRQRSARKHQTTARANIASHLATHCVHVRSPLVAIPATRIEMERCHTVRRYGGAPTVQRTLGKQRSAPRPGPANRRCYWLRRPHPDPGREPSSPNSRAPVKHSWPERQLCCLSARVTMSSEARPRNSRSV